MIHLRDEDVQEDEERGDGSSDGEDVGMCTAVTEIRGQRHLQSHCQSSLEVEVDANEQMRT